MNQDLSQRIPEGDKIMLIPVAKLMTYCDRSEGTGWAIVQPIAISVDHAAIKVNNGTRHHYDSLLQVTAAECPDNTRDRLFLHG